MQDSGTVGGSIQTSAAVTGTLGNVKLVYSAHQKQTENFTDELIKHNQLRSMTATTEVEMTKQVQKEPSIFKKRDIVTKDADETLGFKAVKWADQDIEGV